LKTKIKPFVFWLSVYAFRLISALYFRGSGRGRKNYPKSGAFIIAMNHNSLIDIPAMSFAIDRPAYTMVKESLFKIPVLNWWMRSIGFFPVRRGAGDRQAIEFSRSVIKNGDVLVLAPEGTRRRNKPGKPRAHTGIVRLAQEFQCPIVPVGVRGTRNILPPDAVIPRPRKLSVIVGEPITLEPIDLSAKDKDRIQEQADYIMNAVYQLSGESYN